MDESVGVGLIVGLAIGVTTYLWNSVYFTKVQKYVLLAFIVFPPLQWTTAIILFIYNYQKFKSSKEHKTEVLNNSQENEILDQSTKKVYLMDNKNKMKFSQNETRTVIVLMIINSFALFVNYFGLSYRFGNDADLFTNSNGINGNYIHYPYETMYSSNSNHFYPIVEFTSNSYQGVPFFKGIFVYYDTTEFFVYTIIIFGVVIIRKLW